MTDDIQGFDPQKILDPLKKRVTRFIVSVIADFAWPFLVLQGFVPYVLKGNYIRPKCVHKSQRKYRPM